MLAKKGRDLVSIAVLEMHVAGAAPRFVPAVERPIGRVCLGTRRL